MNCSRCGHANRDGARFCGECAEPIGAAVTCPACGHSNPGGQRFCDQCAHALAALSGAARPSSVATRTALRPYTPRHLADEVLRSKSAIEGERKQITVLFADLKGSMELSEGLDPEVWHRTLDRFFRVLAEAVHRYEGTINQYTGDGIMALFGAPIAHEDHAERACLAALQMRESLNALANELRRELSFDFRARIGLNSGDVIVGKIGDDLRMDYTAQGHSVGLASRVEQLAEPGHVYLTQNTATRVEGLFTLRDLGPTALKGSRERVRVFELESRGPLRTRLDRSQRRGFSKFVGREADLARLEDALAASARGPGRVVALVADPGVGKSRLAQEFSDRCRARGVLVHEAHALSHGQLIPLLPVTTLARAALGVARDIPVDRLRAAVSERLNALGLDAEPVPVLLFELLGAATPDEAAQVANLDPELRGGHLFDALLGIIAGRPSGSRELAASGTNDGAAAPRIVIRVEDAQWADPASERFFALLASRIGDAAGGAGVLLLVTLRPEYRPAWLAGIAHERVELTPLDRGAAGLLLAEWLGDDPSVATLGPLIWERARGNPLFIEEIVQALVERGSLDGGRGEYRLCVPAAELSVPDTVQSIVASRIDRLDERDKHALQVAAVIGQRFSPALVGVVAGLADAELSRAWAALERAQFIDPRDGGERTESGEVQQLDAERSFSHPLTQEVAYAAQLSEPRRQLHAAVAGALMRLHPDGLLDRAAILAHHFECADDALEAARWHERAGRRIARDDTAAGLEHCVRVATLLARLPDSPDALTLGLTSRIAILEIGRLAGVEANEAKRVFREAHDVASRLGDPRGNAFLLTSYGRLEGLAGDVGTYHVLCEEAAAIARESGDAHFVFEMDAHLLLSLIGVGRLADAERLAEQGLAELARDDTLAASPSTAPELCRIRAGVVFAYRGRLAEASVLLQPPVGANADDPRRWESLYGTLALRADVERLRGDAEAALALGRRALEVAERSGGAFARVEAGAALAQAELLAGDATTAAVHAESVLALARRRRAGLWYEPRLLAALAEAALAEGALQRAGAWVAEATSLEERAQGWALAACEAQLTRARVAASEAADVARAESVLDALDARLDRAGASALRPFALLERAHLAERRGDTDACARHRSAARAMLETIGAGGHVARMEA